MLIDQVMQVVKEIKTMSISVTENDVKKFTDLAYIDENLDKNKLKTLCQKAMSKPESTGICVLPDHVELAREYLANSNVLVSAAVNFPQGDGDSKTIRKTIDRGIMNGAQELDIVFPYKLYLEGKANAYKLFEPIVEHIAKRVYTKVIIEVGAFDDIMVVYDLCCGLIDHGLDMIKTSTGMHEKGPNLESVAAILLAIKNHDIGTQTGVKISGGLRTCQDVVYYTRLYQRILNRDWRNKNRMRFGASQLITE